MTEKRRRKYTKFQGKNRDKFLATKFPIQCPIVLPMREAE
jgi:hypothetical protein